MAEFCRQCSDDFGVANDGIIAAKAAGLTKEDFEKGFAIAFLCEGCGQTAVDHEGSCVTDCDEHHKTDEEEELRG